MKKILYFLVGVFLSAQAALATQGYPVVTNGGQYSVGVDATVAFSGAISSTGSVDNSGKINANGYAGIQFKVVKAAYNGTYLIQGSWDGSTWTTIHETSLDGTATTETYYWQCFDGWNYYRIEGDPNGSNAGTATTTAKLVAPDNTGVPHYTGYYGPQVAPQVVLASSLRATSATAYAYTGGAGIEVDVAATATSSGSLTITVSSVDPSGNATARVTSTAITSVTAYAGSRTLIVSPTVAAATNVSVNGVGNRWLINCDEGGTSTTYSVTVKPIPAGNNPIASQP